MRRSLLPALGAILLSGCIAADPAAVSRLSSLSPLEANPTDLTAAVRTAADVIIGEGDVTLTAKFDAREDRFDISETFNLVVDGSASAAPGIAPVKPGQERLVLASLDPDDAARFRAFQKAVRDYRANGGKGSGQISIGVTGCARKPLDPESRLISAWLQTAPDTRFIKLIDGMDMAKLLGGQPVPPCGLDAATE